MMLKLALLLLTACHTINAGLDNVEMSVDADGSLHINSAPNKTIFLNGINMTQLAASVARLESLQWVSSSTTPPTTTSEAIILEPCTLPPGRQPSQPAYNETFRIVGDNTINHTLSANQLAMSNNGTAIWTTLANPDSALKFDYNVLSDSYNKTRMTLPGVVDFGDSVAVSHDGTVTMFGSNIDNIGSVHLLDGVLSPLEPTKFNQTDLGMPYQFGGSVAISGDGMTAAAGVPGFDFGNVHDHGTVVIYKKGAGSWIPNFLVQATELDAEDEFGRNVALSYDAKTLVASAHRANAGSFNGEAHAGVVIVFERSVVDNLYKQQARLEGGTAVAHANFGYRLALSSDGTVLVVTGYAANGLYIYTRSSFSARFGTPARIVPEFATTAVHFGRSLAISACGCVIVAGAELDSTLGDGAGAAYMFSKGTGISYTLQQKLLPGMALQGNTAVENGMFGHAVAVSADGRTIAVAALKDTSNKTAIHVFEALA
eukprot:m.47069 g.47069  ORF g.47069 m.47069 type:complete len:486 (+) comp13197_c0_seq1:82-1539(+)